MRNQLASISSILLNQASTDHELDTALDHFIALCSHVTQIEPSLSFSAWSNDSELKDGVAINPEAAAQCVLDRNRTVTFMRGVFAALTHQRQCHPNRPVTILYAGCGPYATLLLPLLAHVQPEEVTVQLIDIHWQSLESVNKLVALCGFNDFTIHCTQADACTFTSNATYDLIIAETMQKALEQEPQFQLTKHLTTLLSDDGIFVPQRISLQIWLADWNAEKRWLASRHQTQLPKRTWLCDAMQLSQHSANQYTANKDCTIPVATFKVPEVASGSGADIMMTTRITVFDGHQLDDYDCTLTDSSKFYEVSPAKANADYQVAYQLGNYPKFVITEQH